MTGTFFLVSTPIGNLEDISLRAIRVLQEVDLIAAEDTRTARKLLDRYKIKTPVVSYYDAAEGRKSAGIVARLESGKSAALISEAGMPGISDPGYRLVAAALAVGIPVVPIPGATAAVAALAASGLPTDRFAFEGFLPSASAARGKKLYSLLAEERTMIFYESPRRILATLREVEKIFGDRPVVVARELTKIYEEFIRGTAAEVSRKLKDKEKIKGEIVLLLAGRTTPPDWSGITPADQIERAIRDLKISRMEAIKLVAELRGLPKSAVYRDFHRKESSPD
jgi:16S rRNA (cytidine1402-2'-O)-methyltransferase